jgi:IS30 family transposase
MGHHYGQLLEWERSEIYRLLSAGVSQSEIGRRLERSTSTISREIARNRLPRKGYQPVAAERQALVRRHARRTSKIKRLSQLEEHIRDHLAMGQSPEQIAGRLRRVEDRFSISHESIYRFIHSPAGRKEKLHNYLAQAKSRRGRRARLGQRKPLIPDRVSIQDRPRSIKRDLRFGHWEADLMIFSRGGRQRACPHRTEVPLYPGCPSDRKEEPHHGCHHQPTAQKRSEASQSLDDIRQWRRVRRTQIAAPRHLLL